MLRIPRPSSHEFAELLPADFRLQSISETNSQGLQIIGQFVVRRACPESGSGANRVISGIELGRNHAAEDLPRVSRSESFLSIFINLVVLIDLIDAVVDDVNEYSSIVSCLWASPFRLKIRL